MENRQYFFWYSEKQKQIRSSKGLPSAFCLIDGVQKEHTFMKTTEDHDCKIDDIQYLGSGQFSHSGRENN